MEMDSALFLNVSGLEWLEHFQKLSNFAFEFFYGKLSKPIFSNFLDYGWNFHDFWYFQDLQNLGLFWCFLFIFRGWLQILYDSSNLSFLPDPFFQNFPLILTSYVQFFQNHDFFKMNFLIKYSVSFYSS